MIKFIAFESLKFKTRMKNVDDKKKYMLFNGGNICVP